MSISFEPAFENGKPEEYRLPMNFLPYGLEVLDLPQEADERQVGLVVPLDLGAQPEDGIPTVSVGRDVVADPEALNSAILKQKLSAPTMIRRIDEPKPTKHIGFMEGFSCAPANRAVIVIDLGIAFWNAQFGDQFQEVFFISDTLQITPLGSQKINELRAAAGNPGGDRAIVDELGAAFPHSFFGGRVDMHDLWHGTAIADLAGRPDYAGEDVAMFGIELPRSVLVDSRGDGLKTTLGVVLRHTRSLVSQMPEGTIVDIILGFGFPGGPHAALRPDIQQIIRLISSISARHQVHLRLPAGNHLQDKCHARLPAHGSEVSWRIPPDDSSANTVDIGYLHTNPVVGLTTPDGASGSVTPKKGWVYNILLHGQIIGRLHSLPEPMNGWYQIRLALSPTANRAGRRSVPFGDWKIAVESAHETGLWVLRDDDTRDFGAPGIQRPSYFYDPCYRETDDFGATLVTDTYDLPGGCTGPLKVRRDGTASLLTLAEGGRIAVASALESHSGSEIRLAVYSGRAFNGTIPGTAILVDDLSAQLGVEVIGNGSDQAFRFTGTSAAVGMLRPQSRGV